MCLPPPLVLAGVGRHCLPSFGGGPRPNEPSPALAQTEEAEAELELLGAARARGGKAGSSADGPARLWQRVERHAAHIRRIEHLLRMLLNQLISVSPGIRRAWLVGFHSSLLPFVGGKTVVHLNPLGFLAAGCRGMQWDRRGAWGGQGEGALGGGPQRDGTCKGTRAHHQALCAPPIMHQSARTSNTANTCWRITSSGTNPARMSLTTRTNRARGRGWATGFGVGGVNACRRAGERPGLQDAGRHCWAEDSKAAPGRRQRAWSTRAIHRLTPAPSADAPWSRYENVLDQLLPAPLDSGGQAVAGRDERVPPPAHGRRNHKGKPPKPEPAAAATAKGIRILVNAVRTSPPKAQPSPRDPGVPAAVLIPEWPARPCSPTAAEPAEAGQVVASEPPPASQGAPVSSADHGETAAIAAPLGLDGAASVASASMPGAGEQDAGMCAAFGAGEQGAGVQALFGDENACINAQLSQIGKAPVLGEQASAWRPLAARTPRDASGDSDHAMVWPVLAPLRLRPAKALGEATQCGAHDSLLARLPLTLDTLPLAAPDEPTAEAMAEAVAEAASATWFGLAPWVRGQGLGGCRGSRARARGGTGPHPLPAPARRAGVWSGQRRPGAAAVGAPSCLAAGPAGHDAGRVG